MALRRVTLTTRGFIAAGLAPPSALAGVLLGAEELVLLSITLGLLLLCGLVQCAARTHRDRGVWRVGVDLAVSDTEVGRPVAVRVTATTSDRGAAAPVWLEAPERGWVRTRALAGRRPLPSPAQVRRIPALEPGATASFCSMAPTQSRGVFTLQPPRLWCADSVGLVARVVASGPRATVTVYPVPSAVDLDQALLRGDDGETSEPVVPAARTRNDGLGDFSGIRPYVPGDRLRLLYWPALARRDELMVRDFEDSGSHRVQVVADVRPLVGAAGGERVLAAVAGIGLEALARGSAVELSTTAGERMAIGPGPHGPLALLRAVATIETGAPPPPPKRRHRHRHRDRHRHRAAGPGRAPVDRGLRPTLGTQLVVTTSEGARTMPVSFGFAHLVIAP